MFLYFCNDAVLSSGRRGSGRPRYFSESSPPRRGPLDPVTAGELAPESPNQVLGGAVMVGEVPSGKPGIVIREHLRNCAGGLDRAVGARDLPHPVQKAADREIRGEPEAARIGQR